MTNSTKSKTPFHKSNFFRAALGTITVFGIMTIYVFEFAYLQNTFNVTTMVVGAMVIGFIIGLVIGQKKKKKYLDEDERRVVAVGYPVMLALLFPLMASLINRKLNFNPPQHEQVEFFRFEGYGGSRLGLIDGMEPGIDGYSIFFVRNRNIERIRSKEPHYENKVKGQMINIPVSKGILGFEYVEL